MVVVVVRLWCCVVLCCVVLLLVVVVVVWHLLLRPLASAHHTHTMRSNKPKQTNQPTNKQTKTKPTDSNQQIKQRFVSSHHSLHKPNRRTQTQIKQSAVVSTHHSLPTKTKQTNQATRGVVPSHHSLGLPFFLRPWRRHERLACWCLFGLGEVCVCVVGVGVP